METPRQLNVQVAAVEALSPQVSRIVLQSGDRSPLPGFACGASIRVRLNQGGKLIWRPFSLTNAPETAGPYEIIVGYSPASAAWTLATACRGDWFAIRPPVAGMQLQSGAEKHLLIAGGLGITAFLGHLQQLAKSRLPFDLVYACKHRSQALLVDELVSTLGCRLALYESGLLGRLDLATLLAGQPVGTQVYVAGPLPLIASTRAAAAGLGWSAAQVHWDASIPPEAVQPSKTGEMLTV